MAIKPNFLASMGYHIFLTMVLRASAPLARAELRYKQILSELHDIADLLPEGESCDSDDESNEEYTPVQTSSGRRVMTPVIPPNRLDL